MGYTGIGSVGQIYTANGGGVGPNFKTPSASSISITGDSGGALTGSSFTFTGGTTGLTFAGSGTTETLGGTLALANGGTSASLTASNGGIFYSTASAGAILAGTATAHQLLLSGASTTPVWSTTTYPTTNAINTLLYASAANVMSALTTANNGVLITSASGVPSLLAAGTTGQILTATTGSPASWAAPAASSISITGNTGGALVGNAFTFSGGTTGLSFGGSGSTETLSGTVVLANGGTSASLTASNGGIFYSTASAGAILSGTATAGQIIRSGASTAPTWSTTTYPATNAINTLLYASAANVMSALTTANNGVLFTSGSGVPSIGTAPIAVGGTNATSFTQSQGIVVYNGTSLVNYAGPQLSSGGVYSNTSQPAFVAYASVNALSVTGDGTRYTVIFDTVTQQGSGYNATTGVFTAPSTGYYMLMSTVTVRGLTAVNTSGLMFFNGSATNLAGSALNPYVVSYSGLTTMTMSAIVVMSASDTMSVALTINGGTKIVGVDGGGSLGITDTLFYGYKLA